jgi:UDP-N-acetylmuramoyl-L-alanyl-D-glutamate--2,6-diaminopimelate ligase
MMRFRDLLKGIPNKGLTGNLDAEVKGISYDSRRARAGDIFVCVPGTKEDGHKYISQVRGLGVVGLLTGREVEAEANEAVAVVAEPRMVMGQLASRLAGDPSRKMEVVGITGTNGKTTISYLIESISRAEAKECGVIGTINYRWMGKELQSNNTTPESVDIIGLMKEMQESGVIRAAMEVSSHALDQKRVAGIAFRAVIFTNLTPEHLDYHKTMDGYFQAKAKLFTEVISGDWLDRGLDFTPVSAINLDDEFGVKLYQIAQGRKSGYSLDNPEAQYRGKIVEYGWNGIRLAMTTPTGELILQSPLLGRINAYNILAAASALLELGAPANSVAHGVAQLKAVPGRLERVETGRGFLAIVDYAHTPDALENVIRITRELNVKRLILVFGCGGDRDRTKRPKMGAIGARGADLLIVTSDNPRTEDPAAIIAEIEAGIKETGASEPVKPGKDAKGYCVEPDRRAAIGAALASAREGDCVLIAGKGHEDYQILGSQKVHFDDREEIHRALGNGEGGR